MSHVNKFFPEDTQQPASYFGKVSVLLFRNDLFKEIKVTYETFQERQNVLEYIKISRTALSKFRKNTYDFPGGKSFIRTDQIFKETIPKEQILPRRGYITCLHVILFRTESAFHTKFDSVWVD